MRFKRFMSVRRVPAHLRDEFMRQVKKDRDRYSADDALAEAMRDWVAKRQGAVPPERMPLEKGALVQFSLLNLIGSHFSA